jgi:hypothetical protein
MLAFTFIMHAGLLLLSPLLLCHAEPGEGLL